MTPTQKVKTTARFFYITPDLIKSNSRVRLFVIAKQFVCAHLRSFIENDHYRYSLHKLGRLLNRDHSTIVNLMDNHWIDLDDSKYKHLYELYLIYIEEQELIHQQELDKGFN